ncbi:MAG: putative holin-like toxin [Tepidanaerobacteraceae bacterium]
MGTYEVVTLVFSSSMLTISLISLIIALVKAITKGKK